MAAAPVPQLPLTFICMHVSRYAAVRLPAFMKPAVSSLLYGCNADCGQHAPLLKDAVPNFSMYSMHSEQVSIFENTAPCSPSRSAARPPFPWPRMSAGRFAARPTLPWPASPSPAGARTHRRPCVAERRRLPNTVNTLRQGLHCHVAAHDRCASSPPIVPRSPPCSTCLHES